MSYLHYLWIAPLQAFLLFYLFYEEMGWATLAAVLVFVTVMLCNCNVRLILLPAIITTFLQFTASKVFISSLGAS